MPTPKIDKRKHADVIGELEKLEICQTPELAGKNDAGNALIHIFAYMVDDVISRLNKLPEKNAIAFLNMLGTKLEPALPARAPVKFSLRENATEEVTVPAGTQMATSPTDGSKPVIFETEKATTLTTSQLKAIISVDPTQNDNHQVCNHTLQLNSGKTEELFMSSPVQEHVLYLGDDSIFNLHEIAKPADSNSDTTGVRIVLDIGSTGQSFSSLGTKWSYSSQDSGNESSDWAEFGQVEGTNQIFITKTNGKSSSKKTIDKKNTFWIRAIATDPLPGILPALGSLLVKVEATVRPDLAFYNDVPIDANSEFFPFGTQPSVNDTFYIASQEAFTKIGGNVELEIDMAQFGNSSQSFGGHLLVSWEYWDGKSWSKLPTTATNFANRVYDFTVANNKFCPVKVEFLCPDNMAETKVNGKDSFWIRARIVSGNYGIFVPANAKAEIAGSSPAPPKIRKIKITCATKLRPPQYCIAKNNIQISRWNCDGTVFKPFVALSEKSQAVFLGFDKPFSNSNISLFFSFEPQEYVENSKPRIEWSYPTDGRDGKWALIKTLDSTDNLTESGTVEFIGPSDHDKVDLFGQELYWVKAEFQPVSPDYNFKSAEKTAADYVDKNSENPAAFTNLQLNKVLWQGLQRYILRDVSFLLTGPSSDIRFYHPKFSTPRDVKEIPASPKINGVHLNTIWATQTETVTDEVLGISDGTGTLTFDLSRLPALSTSVWVLEPVRPQEETANNGNTLETGETWVEWQPVGDFALSNEACRHYMIDRASGKIQFGNGKNGVIPPVGGTIKVTYKTGGGAKGNLGKGDIKKLVTSIAPIEAVTNVDSAMGGAETETVQRILKKGPKRIQHRFRAVAKEDFEWLAMEASSAVARAVCIPNFNSEGQEQAGCVALIIVPESQEDQPIASAELLRIVRNYVKDKCSISISELTVTSPSYLGISVDAKVYLTSMDLSSKVKLDAMEKLKVFLHPLAGGQDGKGWGFGQMPCASDILGLLQKISGIDHVDDLKVTVRDLKSGESFAINDNVTLPTYALICSNTHRISVEAAEVN